jgi:hypothetical protein
MRGLESSRLNGNVVNLLVGQKIIPVTIGQLGDSYFMMGQKDSVLSCQQRSVVRGAR